MALQQIQGIGQSIWYPCQAFVGAPALSNTTAFAATGDKLAYCGRVVTPNRAAKNVAKLWLRWGAITKAGGSGVTISLQDVNLAAGPVMQPDETQDQTVAVANADAGFVSNGYYQTGALSATRTVNPGDLLAVVFEYDGGGRLGADSVTLSALASVNNANFQQGLAVSKVSGTFAAMNFFPNILLEFDDGTFGTFAGAMPIKTVNVHTYKQDTGGSDEFALAFQVPFSCKVDAAILPIAVANGADFSVILYDGTTPMPGGTITVDANSVRNTTGNVHFLPFGQEIAMVINHQYYLAVQPTQTAASVSVYSFDMQAATHLVAHPGGVNFNYTTRVDTGAWAAITTTRRLAAGLHISSLDDGAGSGGGTNIFKSAIILGAGS